ncbi:MAG TPA: peptidylprolyl isomerase [Dissulfurispiraceae bacterium]|nr:peptidylprolyl isomerase [Dissulfurispiraceae bacterium]
MKKYVLLLLCLGLLMSCSQGVDSKKQGEVVAKIDGSVITTKDIEQEINALPEFAREFFKGQEGTSRLVDELVKKELLYAEAKKRGLDKDEEFQRKFEEAKKNALITRLLEKELKSLPQVTDKEVKDYYDAHKDEFIQPNAIRLSQIVVKTEDDAKKVYERLQKGEPFNKLADEVSIDKTSAKSGGDLGLFKKGEMNPDLEKVAFRLKKNQISMPIPLKDGIHIIVPTDIKGTALDFDKIKGAISQQLMAKKQQDNLEQFIEGLKKNYKVEVNKENMAKIKIGGTEPAAPEKAPEKAAPSPEKK